MSHFTITVAMPADVPADGDALREHLEAILAPFDEELEVPRYVQYTREQLIAKARKEIEDYKNGRYAQYLADPVKYLTECQHHLSHARYISGQDEDGGFPEKLNWTDEQVYQDEIRWYEPSKLGPDGEVYSERNPRSKWDWWVVGGRWGGRWTFKAKPDYPYLDTHVSLFGPGSSENPSATDCSRVGDLDPEGIGSSWGYVDLDGEWHEKGSMGWFGMSDADESETGEARWQRHYREWFDSLSADTWVVNVDCHI